MGTTARARRWRTGARALTLLGILAGSSAPAGAQQSTFASPAGRATLGQRPNPGLEPHDVVTIILDALRHNDMPTKDRGIAVTFDFSSPANRDATGPFDRFAALAKNPDYWPMLNHQRVERGEMVLLGAEARQRVTVVGAGGERVTYTFILTRQEEGEFRGCWMTDGVVRETELKPDRYQVLTN